MFSKHLNHTLTQTHKFAEQVVPEKRWHTVEVQWIVPPERPNYRSQPCGSLSHLLGYSARTILRCHASLFY